MTCEEARTLLGAYQDRELSAADRSELETHLAGCPACAALLQRNLKLSEAIRSWAPSYAAPESLKTVASKRRPSFTAGLAIGLAASFIAFWVFFLRPTPGLSADLVADHVRSLMANHLIDVASSDRHTVKPWFLGKVDFAPTVPDLAAAGYPLIGGRLDYVDGRPAAALVYKKGGHVINVLIQPEKGSSPSEAGQDGYRILHWKSGDLGYWAVSDIAREDLRAFAEVFRRTP